MKGKQHAEMIKEDDTIVKPKERKKMPRALSPRQPCTPVGKTLKFHIKLFIPPIIRRLIVLSHFAEKDVQPEKDDEIKRSKSTKVAQGKEMKTLVSKTGAPTRDGEKKDGLGEESIPKIASEESSRRAYWARRKERRKQPSSLVDSSRRQKKL